MHGIKKFTICYSQEEIKRSVEKGSLTFSKDQSQIIQLDLKNKKLNGVFIENIMHKNVVDWNLENVYKYQIIRKLGNINTENAHGEFRGLSFGSYIETRSIIDD